MGVEIKSEHIDIGGSNVVLASVRGGKAVIGPARQATEPSAAIPRRRPAFST